MIIICETDKLLLKHFFEEAVLIEKSTKRVLIEDDFYGDPTCGLIDVNNNWAIVAGDHLTIWTRKMVRISQHEDLRRIHALRVKDLDKVEILTDPYASNAAIWEINTKTCQVYKVKDFNNYKDKEYTENIIW